MKKNKLGISYGILAPSIEKQLKEQGFTLSENKNKTSLPKCEFIQKMRKRVNHLRMSNFLTEAEADKVCQRMQKYIVKHLKQLPAKEENEAGIST